MRKPTIEKQPYRANLLKTAEDSGLSLIDFAKSKDIPVHKLYQWRSTLREQSTNSHQPLPVHFAQVTTSLTPGSLTIELNGARLRFDRLPDTKWLTELLHAQGPKS